MTALLIVLYLLLAAAVSAVIISENRNPLKAMSWILVVTFVPVLGMIIYIFFGQDQRRRRIVSRRIYKRIMHKPHYLSIPEVQLEAMSNIQLNPIMKLINNNADSPVMLSDRPDIFTTGQEMFDRFFRDIEEARHHIHIQFYVIADDRLGNQMADLLIRKAAEGVKVRLIYDHVGSWTTGRQYWRRLRDGGVEVYSFMPVFFPFLSGRVNYRNHRKVAVIDGRIGYLGGMNAADRYYYGNKLGMWRDSHFRMTGSVVAGLQSSFLLDWYVVSRRVINLSGYYPDQPLPYSDESMKIQLVRSGPVGQWRTIEQATIYCIERACEHIYIETPYFLPTEGLNNALITAALAGIEVHLIVPRRSDARLPQIAALSYVEDLLEAGVHIYLYKEGFLHSKMMMIDGQVASIGSTNMDFRSLENNFEFNGIIYDEPTVQRLEAIFFEDLLQSEPLDLKRWRKRSRIKKFSESFIRLFAPLL
ncbi:cardiolipin synthase [Porphyromonas loveana]|uniref:cardiolipin synthase n=1 Tax=Porphyromonas loveana TaxID=1884669 RepID=UPI0035A00327